MASIGTLHKNKKVCIIRSTPLQKAVKLQWDKKITFKGTYYVNATSYKGTYEKNDT